ncbi:hypothetical protein BDY21DRAFT_66370 [Lineolata rhizophorae]|uniref:SnoaL-like domain-containing protein n=1 Tax=Lineolata rhizophorae TaxID=578093 RepID=A0A6A6NUS9_9PEZI|nr:hypothetical protein BDY21DRAFT_66370 [Lineolata rhizophorae]
MTSPGNTGANQQLPQAFEKRPDSSALTGTSSKDVDYEPYPSQSVPLDESQQQIVESICNLYSGSASESDMQVYADSAVYDDPWSYCDTRYKIAGQWYGIPKVFASSATLRTQIMSATPTEIVFKLQQEYTPRLAPTGKAVNSLVTLSLDENGKVRYHKDMWNEKDYSHEGLGKVFKTLNGDHLTKITKPPDSL